MGLITRIERLMEKQGEELIETAGRGGGGVGWGCGGFVGERRKEKKA